jgi:hypothetical protein
LLHRSLAHRHTRRGTRSHVLGLSLERFFLEEGFDANAACLASEVATESIGAGESAATTPTTAVFKVAFADKLFLARVQALVALAVVLASECFAADAAYERALVGVCTKM